MRKRRTSWHWGVADSAHAGALSSSIMFRTRKEARNWAKFCGPGRYYAVKIEVSWDIKEKDRW